MYYSIPKSKIKACHVNVREKEEAQSSLANHYQMNKRKSIIFMESIREKEEGG
jgi:hypothetical protein